MGGIAKSPGSLELVWDAVAFYDIPGEPLVLLGYVDVYDEVTGLSIYQCMRQRWPGATVIPITVDGTHELTYDGKRVRMCDQEFRDLTPQGAAQWCYEEFQLGAPNWAPPTPYCQAANGAALQAALADVGLRMGIDCPWAMAWWNGQQDLLPPPPPWPTLPLPVYHQFMSIYDTYDLAVAVPDWIWPSPPPPPKPKPREGDDMIFSTNGTVYHGTVALDPATGKARGAAIVLGQNGLAAYQAEVTAGNQPPPVPDKQNGLYNLYVLGNDPTAGPALQVSDKPGEDTSGKIGWPNS